MLGTFEKFISLLFITTSRDRYRNPHCYRVHTQGPNELIHVPGNHRASKWGHRDSHPGL